MTMLDRMRRHRSWLKWILGVVVVAFIFIYVPSFLQPRAAGAPTEAIATVDGRPVLVGTYQRLYQQQVQSFRNQFGEQFTEQMLQQYGITQRIIQQLVDDEATCGKKRGLAKTHLHGHDAPLACCRLVEKSVEEGTAIALGGMDAAEQKQVATLLAIGDEAGASGTLEALVARRQRQISGRVIDEGRQRAMIGERCGRLDGARGGCAHREPCCSCAA